MLVHNALPRNVTQTISVPIKQSSWEVSSVNGDAAVLSTNMFKSLPVHPEKHDEAEYNFVFSAELQPLTTHRFHLKKSTPVDNDSEITSESQSASDSEATDGDNLSDRDPSQENDSRVTFRGNGIIRQLNVMTLENDLVKVEIDKATGSVVSITNKAKNITLPLSSQLLYYRPYQCGVLQYSGAYIFNPKSKTVHDVAKESSVKYIEVQVDTKAPPTRAAFQIGTWATIQYKLNDNDEFLEVEWTVGPIPIDDKIGKEVILRFDTQRAIKSNATLYTDSNGLEFVQRIRNFRPTWNLTLHDDQEFVAANYFPITTGLYIQDGTHQLNVATDRAQGAASLKDGQVEIMVHRVLLSDDEKGVGEHLLEEETFVNPVTNHTITTALVARGSFFVNVDSTPTAMKALRSQMEKRFFAPLVAFRKLTSDEDAVVAKVPWLSVSEFPENVGLTTLLELDKQCLLTRLTHLYSVGEHPTLSKPVTVDFGQLFRAKWSFLKQVTEMTLTATTPLVDVDESKSMKEAWITNEDDDDNEDVAYVRMPVHGTTVTLQAMEVRAFKVCFAKSQDSATQATSTEDVSTNMYDRQEAEVKAERLQESALLAME